MANMPAKKKKSCFQITSVTQALVGVDTLQEEEVSPSDLEPGGHFSNNLAGRYISLQAPIPFGMPLTNASTNSCSSRFRVIKLDHSTGEPYKRGRWTCTEFYERDTDGRTRDRDGMLGSGASLSAPLASATQQAQPFTSLPSHFSANHVDYQHPNLPVSQGSALVLTPIAMPILRFGGHCVESLLPRGQMVLITQQTPNWPGSVAEGQMEEKQQQLDTLLQTSGPEKNGTHGLSCESLHIVTTDVNTPMEVDTNGEEPGACGASAAAINNKIEQAMDLVKSHLMYAVREEVEVLREQIKELYERNFVLERENAVLKSLANNEQLSEHSVQLNTSSSSSLTGTTGLNEANQQPSISSV